MSAEDLRVDPRPSAILEREVVVAGDRDRHPRPRRTSSCLAWMLQPCDAMSPDDLDAFRPKSRTTATPDSEH